MQNRDFPGGLVVEISPSSARGASSALVGELRFHMPCSQKTKKQKRYCNKFRTTTNHHFATTNEKTRPDHLTCLLRNLYADQEATEPDMEQQTGSKSEKEYVKAVYCHSAYLTCIQSTSCKMLGWRKHELESRLPGEISITSDMQITPPLCQKAKKN